MTNICWQKRWFQPAPKNVLTCVFYLSLCSLVCVCARPPKKKVAGQIRIRRSLTPRVISPENMERFSFNFGKTNIFPLGTCHFNANSLLYSILTWSIILCFCSGSARLWHRRGILWEWCPAKKPARQVKDLKANHENVICRSVGDIVAVGARASWRTSCG